ncbi:MAG: epoxyqueuosine reductase QueH [Proteobacteria bacterium]|nr:epoxyqueuosine reductase QueH [Pseudomonadota bacterium]MBU4470738.1 epoxyqueuosine reductase QueH [Pseudomonadota bacterium]MCG2751534.1 epoxyqueuosine reductase QueH [Desulfobacteraceae bacterium]
MKMLLHICCGPCAVYPVETLRSHNFDIMGYFYRNNIHPFSECAKREETLKTYADNVQLKVIFQEGYNLEGFLRNVAFREKDRCAYCYHARLETAAGIAKHGGFDAFSSTLLYSKFQNHDMIQSIGKSVAKSVGVDFYYEDFRTGWKTGIEHSKKMNLYRQQYCGCIYSEKERFYKKERS